MTAESDLEHVAAAERHNRLAKQRLGDRLCADLRRRVDVRRDDALRKRVGRRSSRMLQTRRRCKDARSDRGPRQGTAREGSTGRP
jgi:hypothetical protein